MLITDILSFNSAARPDKVAVICGERQFTFREVARRTLRLANALRRLGVAKGDRVAVLGSNTAEYVEMVFAISAVGAVWVPLNFRLAPAELAFIVRDCGATTVLFTDDNYAPATATRDLVPEVKNWISIGAHGASAGVLDYDDLLRMGSDTTTISCTIDPTDLFAVMYTSGTTGRPKGVMLPHDRFLSGTLLSSLGLKITENDVKLQVIPQFHAGGQIYQLSHLACGSTIVICPKFEPELVLRLIASQPVTTVGLVPSMLVALLETPAILRTDFSRLRRVMYGGSSIPEDRLARALELTQADFSQTYGQTEAGVLVSILDEADHRLGLTKNPEILRSCGRAILGYDIRLEGDGDLGEMHVRSSSLMSGYWGRADATASTLVDGWLLTGDVARRDDEGRFYIVDRKKDMIVSGGENIAPAEIEGVLSRHRDVLDVAVIGVPDDRWGEAVKALVVLRPGRTPQPKDLTEFCRGSLGGYKIPKSIEFVDGLPRNASGKILKAQLRDPYWQGRERKV